MSNEDSNVSSQLQSAKRVGVRPMINKEGIRQKKLTIGGVIAFILIIVQAFIPSGKLDTSAIITLLAFAIAIPFLAIYALLCDELELLSPLPIPALEPVSNSSFKTIKD